MLSRTIASRSPFDRAVHALIERMVAPRPDDRIDSAAAVVGELEALIARRAAAVSGEAASEWGEVPTARSTPLSLHRYGT